MQRCDDICKRLGRYTPRCITDRLDFDFSEAVQEAIEVIHILSDAKPVVHGKWEEVHEMYGVEYSCSVCGCYALWKELTTDQVCTEYCPNCGADMRGEDNV